MTEDQLSLPATSRFASILERIRDETSKILKIPLEKLFTDHSVEGHSTRVLQHLYGLTYDLRAPLRESEVYILIASAYLHDLSLAWDCKMDFLELRKNHPKLSAELIRSIAKGEEVSGIRCDLGIPGGTSPFGGMYTELIARVVEGHGGTVASDDYSDRVLGNSKIRVRFLADLLALADELDIHRDRVDFTRLAQSRMPEADIFHWWKHWFVVGVKVEKRGTVQVSYAFPEDMRTNSEFPDLVQRYVRLRLQTEYAKVETTLRPEGITLYQLPPTKDFTDIAAPGEARPSPTILDLFRNAVSSLDPGYGMVQESEELSRTIELATQYLMESMLPAGVGAKLYVRRRDSEECFEEFVEHASEQIFVLAGRPGTGKTMFMLRMTNKYPTFSLVYRYSGGSSTIGDLPQHIAEQYATVIANKLQAKKHSKLNIRGLEEIAKSKGKCVILHIESSLSLNNLTEENGLLYRLALSIRERNIKVCLSCVGDVGETFSVSEEVARMIYQSPSRMGVMAPSSVLGDYSEEEFANACLRYFEERKVKLSEADIMDEARDRLKHPLWLDIFSMARAENPHSGIETNIRYVEVCESFLRNRSAKAANILGLNDGELLIKRSLDKVAMKMLSTLGSPLERSLVEELISTEIPGDKTSPGSILDAMRMAGLIKESFDGSSPEGRIRFTFEEIREYLVARDFALDRLSPADEVTAGVVRERFSEILVEGDKKIGSPYGTGVLEFLILLLEDAAKLESPSVLILPKIDIQTVNQLLKDLAKSPTQRGQQVCARVLGKLSKHPDDLAPILDTLSTSEHPRVRADLTYSLSALSREAEGPDIDARGILCSLLDDKNESVACCAVAALIKSFENEAVPPDWVGRFMSISKSSRRELITTMTREFGRRKFSNAKDFLPEISKNLCLRENSDPQIAAAACGCLSKTWTHFPEDALEIVCGAIKHFSDTRQDDVVMRQAVPTLISMAPWGFEKEVCRFLEEMAKLKRNENLKCEIVRNNRKLPQEDREKLLGILEGDESNIVKALVFSARNT